MQKKADSIFGFTLTRAQNHRTYLTATDLACRAVLQKSSTCSGAP